MKHINTNRDYRTDEHTTAIEVQAALESLEKEMNTKLYVICTIFMLLFLINLLANPTPPKGGWEDEQEVVYEKK